MARKLTVETHIEIANDAVPVRIHYRMDDEVTGEFFGTANVHIILPRDGQTTVDQLKEKALERSKEVLAELASLIKQENS